MLVYLFFQCLPFLKIMLYNFYYVNLCIGKHFPGKYMGEIMEQRRELSEI